MKPDAHLILIAVTCGLNGCAEGYGGYGGGYRPAYYGSNYLGYGGGYDYYNRRPPPYLYQQRQFHQQPQQQQATPRPAPPPPPPAAAFAARGPAVAQSARHPVQLTRTDTRS
jgi:hypothetical protein